METASTIAEARSLVDRLPRPLGFVPTMGALHDGHLELARRARSECAAVAASIFVNPLQFGANEDLATYPRDFVGDRSKFSESGVDVLFAPPVDSMYPSGFSTNIEVGSIGTVFEGAVRPTHFAGVATVVTKLLHIIRPDVLYLGQKDAQQTAVLRKVVRELEFTTRVVIVPTVRESDGLAMSSRNAYLNPDQRREAPALHRALNVLRDALSAGASKIDAVTAARASFGPLASVEYLEVVDADTFAPIETLRAPAFVIGVARFGTTRLLDNLWIAT